MMQEHSVSSTTASPGKLIDKVKTMECANMEVNAISFIDPTLKPEKQEDICDKTEIIDGSRKHRHSKHRYHTCSKAKRKNYSSSRKSSRQTRSRRKHGRSHRSRSSSRYYSSSHKHKHHHKLSNSSSRSSSLSNESVRSSNYSVPISQGSADASQNGLLDTENSMIASALSSDNIQQCAVTSLELPDVFKSGVPIRKGFADLSHLSQSHPITNSLLTLLNSRLNCPNQLSNSIIDLLGTVIPSLLPPSSASPSFVPSIPLSATRQARRLYVGGIPAGITSESMVEFFNTELLSRGLCRITSDPVISAQVNSERHFAFIELRSVEETTNALYLDGISCMGNSLRVRRPRDYMTPNSGTTTSNSNLPGDHFSANSIFISGIPSNMQETQLRGLLNAFGPLKSFNMLLDAATGTSRGCGFFEFSTIEEAERASSGLMNLPVCEGKLFSIRADLLAGPLVPSPSTSCSSSSSSITTTAVISNSSSSVPVKFGGDDLSEATPILCLMNMVTPSEIERDEDYAEILDDVRDECSLHGRVRSIQMPRESGRIYVEFATISDAVAGKLALSGRKFNGRTVAVSFFAVQAYTRRDF